MYMTLFRFANVCSIIVTMYLVFRQAISLELSCAMVSSLISLTLLFGIAFHRMHLGQQLPISYAGACMFICFSLVFFIAIPFWEGHVYFLLGRQSRFTGITFNEYRNVLLSMLLLVLMVSLNYISTVYYRHQ
jgi:hypothetical protein